MPAPGPLPKRPRETASAHCLFGGEFALHCSAYLLFGSEIRLALQRRCPNMAMSITKCEKTRLNNRPVCIYKRGRRRVGRLCTSLPRKKESCADLLFLRSYPRAISGALPIWHYHKRRASYMEKREVASLEELVILGLYFSDFQFMGVWTLLLSEFNTRVHA